MKYKVGVKVIWLFVLVTVSCTPARHLPFKSFSLEPHTQKTLLSEIEKTENSHEYTQISRFTAEYNGMQEQSNFKGYVRMAEDSLLMLSMSGPIGGEVMRVLLSPERSQTLNRLEETYTFSDYDAADQLIPVPFEMLQAVLNYKFTSLLEDYKLSIEDKMYLLTGAKNKTNYAAVKVDGNYMVRQFFYKDFTSNVSVRIDYQSFVEVDGKLFPSELEVHVQNGTNNAILRLLFKRVDFKEGMTFPFSIPERYLK